MAGDIYVDDALVLQQGPIVESDELRIDALEPGGGLMSRRVRRLDYEHVEEEGENIVRYHRFTEPGTLLIATPDPRVVILVNPTLPIVEDF